MIMLHGLGASLDVWLENIGPLSEIGTVYAVDLPGHGKSDKPFGLLYDSMAGGHFLVSLMDALGLSSAVLVGNSAGGLVASWCAVNHPDRVSWLVVGGHRRIGPQHALVPAAVDHSGAGRIPSYAAYAERSKHGKEHLPSSPA